MITYQWVSAFTNENKQTLDTNLVHKGDRAGVKISYLKYVTLKVRCDYNCRAVRKFHRIYTERSFKLLDDIWCFFRNAERFQKLMLLK